jgi:hypothetical protein
MVQEFFYEFNRIRFFKSPRFEQSTIMCSHSEDNLNLYVKHLSDAEINSA